MASEEEGVGAKLDPALLRARNDLLRRLQAAGIRHQGVLAAIARTPRHEFVEEAFAHRAYEDTALPIGLGQTISQPYVVALMTEALLGTTAEPPPRVLEIGTGCGYQSAILAQLVGKLFTVERLVDLHERARARLRALGLYNVRYKVADGHYGWREQGPFDAIIVTAAPESVPRELIAQLRIGGRLIIPVGSGDNQELRLITRMQEGIRQQLLSYVRFVPLVPDSPADGAGTGTRR